ncbi:hypothetical protein OAO87_03520, partial [bacterium]|nr:hypothetical protein [bacterium]
MVTAASDAMRDGRGVISYLQSRSSKSHVDQINVAAALISSLSAAVAFATVAAATIAAAAIARAGGQFPRTSAGRRAPKPKTSLMPPVHTQCSDPPA